MEEIGADRRPRCVHPQRIARHSVDGIAEASAKLSLRSSPQARARLAATLWDFLPLPNCAPEVFIHARRQVFVVRIRDLFAYRLRVLKAVTANAATPFVGGEDVRTPFGASRVGFGRGHFRIPQKEPKFRMFRPFYRIAAVAIAPP